MENEIHVNLNTVEELFSEPDDNPFSPTRRHQSGIEEAGGKLRLMPLSQKTRFVITLTGESPDEATKTRLKEAIDWYCSVRIDENLQLVRETRHQGRRDLVLGLILAAAVVVIAGLFSVLVPMPEAILGIFWSFIILTLWVIVWTPVDTLVYYWRPYARDVRLYQNLREADLVVESVQTGK